MARTDIPTVASCTANKKGSAELAFQLGTFCAEHTFCLIVVLISVFAAAVRAQTSGENDVDPFSSLVASLSLCGQAADGCILSSAAPGQDDSNPNDSDVSSSRQQNDW